MKLILTFLTVVISVSATSCAGFSGNFKIPLPDRFGGGTVPIIIEPRK